LAFYLVTQVDGKLNTNFESTSYRQVNLDGLKLNDAAVGTVRHHRAILLGTPGILSVILLPWGLSLFSHFLWDHIVDSCARLELLEYMVNTFAFVLSGVYMVVKLRSSNTGGGEVSHLLHIYLVGLAIRAMKCFFVFPVLFCGAFVCKLKVMLT